MTFKTVSSKTVLSKTKDGSLLYRVQAVSLNIYGPIKSLQKIVFSERNLQLSRDNVLFPVLHTCMILSQTPVQMHPIITSLYIVQVQQAYIVSRCNKPLLCTGATSLHI